MHLTISSLPEIMVIYLQGYSDANLLSCVDLFRQKLENVLIILSSFCVDLCPMDGRVSQLKINPAILILVGSFTNQLLPMKMLVLYSCVFVYVGL